MEVFFASICGVAVLLAEGAGSLVCGDFTIIGDMAEGVAEFTGWEGLVMLTFHEIWVTLFDERGTQ